jgi:hypothetical protein
MATAGAESRVILHVSGKCERPLPRARVHGASKILAEFLDLQEASQAQEGHVTYLDLAPHFQGNLPTNLEDVMDVISDVLKDGRVGWTRYRNFRSRFESSPTSSKLEVDLVHLLHLADKLGAKNLCNEVVAISLEILKNVRDRSSLIHAVDRPLVTEEFLVQLPRVDQVLSPYRLAELIEGEKAIYLLLDWDDESQTCGRLAIFLNLTLIFGQVDGGGGGDDDEGKEELELFAHRVLRASECSRKRRGVTGISTTARTYSISVGYSMDNILPDTQHELELYWSTSSVCNLAFDSIKENAIKDVALVLDRHGAIRYIDARQDVDRSIWNVG